MNRVGLVLLYLLHSISGYGGPTLTISSLSLPNNYLTTDKNLLTNGNFSESAYLMTDVFVMVDQSLSGWNNRKIKLVYSYVLNQEWSVSSIGCELVPGTDYASISTESITLKSGTYMFSVVFSGVDDEPPPNVAVSFAGKQFTTLMADGIGLYVDNSVFKTPDQTGAITFTITSVGTSSSIVFSSVSLKLAHPLDQVQLSGRSYVQNGDFFNGRAPNTCILMRDYSGWVFQKYLARCNGTWLNPKWGMQRVVQLTTKYTPAMSQKYTFKQIVPMALFFQIGTRSGNNKEMASASVLWNGQAMANIKPYNDDILQMVLRVQTIQGDNQLAFAYTGLHQTKGISITAVIMVNYKIGFDTVPTNEDQIKNGQFENPYIPNLSILSQKGILGWDNNPVLVAKNDFTTSIWGRTNVVILSIDSNYRLLQYINIPNKQYLLKIQYAMFNQAAGCGTISVRWNGNLILQQAAISKENNEIRTRTIKVFDYRQQSRIQIRAMGLMQKDIAMIKSVQLRPFILKQSLIPVDPLANLVANGDFSSPMLSKGTFTQSFSDTNPFWRGTFLYAATTSQPVSWTVTQTAQLLSQSLGPSQKFNVLSSTVYLISFAYSCSNANFNAGLVLLINQAVAANIRPKSNNKIYHLQMAIKTNANVNEVNIQFMASNDTIGSGLFIGKIKVLEIKKQQSNTPKMVIYDTPKPRHLDNLRTFLRMEKFLTLGQSQSTQNNNQAVTVTASTITGAASQSQNIILPVRTRQAADVNNIMVGALTNDPHFVQDLSTKTFVPTKTL